MTDTLVTAVGNTADRLLVMELLAVPDADTAVKAWHYNHSVYPYFTNRISALAESQTLSGGWDLQVNARLWLAHMGAANNPDDAGYSPQANAWEYIPAMIRYFDTYPTLDPPDQGEITYDEIQYLAPNGVACTCPGGLRDAFNPYTGATALYIDFLINVRFLIME